MNAAGPRQTACRVALKKCDAFPTSTSVALRRPNGLYAQEPPRENPPRLPGGAAAEAQAGRPGPWNNDVLVYRIAADGTAEQTATFERAGVPTLARLTDGRLIAAHQHFPRTSRGLRQGGRALFQGRRTNLDGTAGPATNRPARGHAVPFRPTLVPLPDGRVRLYFTSVKRQRIDEAPPAIYSAISSDGVHYEFEPGQRFGIEGRIVIDCAVVLHRGVFHLFSPDNGPAGPRRDRERPPDGGGYHATSADGLNFTRGADVRIDGRRSWLGNAQSDGKALPSTAQAKESGRRPARTVWNGSAALRSWFAPPIPVPRRRATAGSSSSAQPAAPALKPAFPGSPAASSRLSVHGVSHDRRLPADDRKPDVRAPLSR